MSNKFKYTIFLLIISASFLMMVDIEPVGIVGDFLLEKIGVKAWSGENTGFHIAILYYAFIIFIGLKFLKYHRQKLGISKIKTFIYFVIIVSLLKVGILEVSYKMKGSSDGLLSVGYDISESSYSIKESNGNMDFDISIKIKNYSDDVKSFSIALDNSHWLDEMKKPILIYDLDERASVFVLEAGEAKMLEVTSDKYIINYHNFMSRDGSWSISGEIESLTLHSLDDQSVRLSADNYFGTVLK